MSAACVTGLGVHVPSQRTSAAQIAAASGLSVEVVIHKLGIRKKVAPGAEDHPTAMAVAAARHALAESGIGAEQVDVVISMTEEYKEYPIWTSGIKLAHDLGACHAYAFDIGQKCDSGVLGLKLARDLIRADPDVNTVLLAGGYRNGDLIDYRDPDVRFMYSLAAGAGAAVIERDRPGHEILGASILTDGSLSEDVLIPVGGTRTALTPANVHQFRLQVPHPQAMRERLDSCSVANFLHVIRQAVERSQATRADIAYMALLHMKRSAHDQVLELLDVPVERSIYLDRYGHIGQVDQILSLILAREDGRLAHGDLAVLVAAGVGYCVERAVPALVYPDDHLSPAATCIGDHSELAPESRGLLRPALGKGAHRSTPHAIICWIRSNATQPERVAHFTQPITRARRP